MERLDKIFGSPARLRLLRLFLFNQDTTFTFADVAGRSSLERETARRELVELSAAGLISKKGVGIKAKYHVNGRFEHLGALDTFIRETTALSRERILAALKRVGTLKVVALSGLFTGALEAQIDLLVAGDSLDTRALAKAVKGLEAELGREIRYAAFETPDFRYRLGVYDRLLRDVFDYPHRVLIDRIGL
ncbi:MAG TPA: hypothetical protein VJK73_01995 [Candidatus Paceibacterota bacterium]